MPIIFASAIPHCINLSGKAFINAPSFSEPARSAVNATMFSFSVAASKIPSPKPLLVSFLPVTSISLSMFYLFYLQSKVLKFM